MNINGIKLNKSKTEGIRITWMSRTSDIVGSFHDNSEDANTALIRRKIQERCGNTQELMSTIRRLKTGNTGHVTPNEFRLTLLKFGISIPQHLVDSIFNLFDSDRSGTIDFDEFAMWIMNSEFKPVLKDRDQIKKVNHQDILRSKLRNCLTNYSREFSTMKKRMTFLDFSSDCSNKNIPFTDSDIRLLFQYLDPKNIGYIETSLLHPFAFEGHTTLTSSSSSSSSFSIQNNYHSKPNLEQAIFKICGKHTDLLLDCFRHYRHDSKLNFEEFRRRLLTNNLGVEKKDADNLFLALDGEKGLCNLEKLFSFLPKPHSDDLNHGNNNNSHNDNNIDNNNNNIDLTQSNKIIPKVHNPSFIPHAKVNRRFRESLRKCYQQILSNCIQHDKNQTGYLSPQILCNIINRVAMPINYEDLRLMLGQIQSNDSGEFNYQQLFAPYDPKRISPHELAGPQSTYIDPSLLSPMINVKKSRSESNLLSTHRPTTSSNNNNSNNNSSSNDNSNIESQSNEFYKTNNTTKCSTKVLQSWEFALRSCKAIDEEKYGFIPRKKFHSILEQHLGKILSKNEVNEFANKYQVGNDVDYKTFFRLKLNEVMNQSMIQSTPDSIFQVAPLTKSRSLGPAHPWDFKYQCGTAPLPTSNSSLSQFKSESNHQSLFQTTPNNSNLPYWKRACVDPKSRPLTTTGEISSTTETSFTGSGSSTGTVNKSFNSTSIDKFSSNNSNTFNINSYDIKLVPILSKIISHPQCKQLFDSYKRNQLPLRQGFISNKYFLNSLQIFQIPLKKSEVNVLLKEFRAIGLPDTFAYNDFLQVCNHIKDHTK